MNTKRKIEKIERVLGETLPDGQVLFHMWQTFINLIEQGLLFFNQALATLGVPYSFGFAIILFTLTIKGLTYPLNVKQIKASRAQQALQPQLKALQKKYGDDREALAKAQMELYKNHGANPLGGCLPTLVQMPIWLGLYRALFALARQPNSPLAEGFFWIPSLIGPIGLGDTFSRNIDWLLPSSDTFLGWPDAIAYLVLPVILVISQIYTQRMMTVKTDNSQQKAMGQFMMFMPLMFGYFSLLVPSGLSLYWFTSNILSLVQQHFTLKNRETDSQQTEQTGEITDLSTSAQQSGITPPIDSLENESSVAKKRRTRTKRKRRAKKKSKKR